MTHQELEAAVLCIIEEVYKSKYLGQLKIDDLLDCNGKVTGYKLVLGLNNYERPLTIFLQGNQEDFLKNVRKELKNRRLHHTAYFTGYQVPVVEYEKEK